MSRLLLLALLLTPFCGQADSIYRTTDEQGNVVFTDTPPANSNKSEEIGVQRTNIATPPQVMPAPEQPNYPEDEQEGQAYTVIIITPANETSFPMGPGNFSVRVRVSPALKSGEGLQLFVDGEPRGDLQRATTWDLTNVFRGQRDITVGVVNGSGETLSLSEPVRVFVHRPSTNFKNRQ
jgi:hypothetical protein